MRTPIRREEGDRIVSLGRAAAAAAVGKRGMYSQVGVHRSFMLRVCNPFSEGALVLSRHILNFFP